MKRRNELLRRIAFYAEYRTDKFAPVVDVCGLESIPHVGDFSVNGDAVGIADLRQLVHAEYVALMSGANGRLDRVVMTARGLKVVEDLDKSWWNKGRRRVEAWIQKLAEVLAGVDTFAAYEAEAVK